MRVSTVRRAVRRGTAATMRCPAGRDVAHVADSCDRCRLAVPAVASGSVRKHSWRVTWRWWGITGRWWWRVARRPWLVTRWPWWWGIWTSRLQQALTERAAIFGDWVVGPTVLGPASFAQAGYDYVGFDCQHGYLDDADMAGLLRQLEHVRSPRSCDSRPTRPRRSGGSWTRAPTRS